jgi:triosephosphate isomerase (TIM)
MNLNHFEAIQTVQKLHYLLPKDVYDSVDVSVHPPFTDIRSVQTVIEVDDLDLILGAQHCHFEDTGAFTGEISPAFLAKLDVKMVVCGHSERRDIFGETDEMVNEGQSDLKHGMTPIMCCGESLAEREAGETEAKVLGQVAGRTRRLSAEQVGVTGHRLRADLGDRHRPDGDGRRCAIRVQAIRTPSRPSSVPRRRAAVRIQYGGSVKAGTTEELMSQPDVDGALVGGASLDPGRVRPDRPVRCRLRPAVSERPDRIVHGIETGVSLPPGRKHC